MWSQCSSLNPSIGVVPRTTDRLVLARVDGRGAARALENSFAIYRNRNSALQGTLNVFSRLIWEGVYS